MTPPCCLLKLEHTCGESHLRPVITFKVDSVGNLENGKPSKNIGKMIGKLLFNSQFGHGFDAALYWGLVQSSSGLPKGIQPVL